MQLSTQQDVIKGKRCFIITPIGSEGSEIREKAEGVIEAISPVIEEFGFQIDIPHRMPKPGSITQQVLECILNNDLVVANLTGLNPNVMYELAVRHASAKPVITVAEDGTELPFDIKTERAISYTNNMRGVPKLQKELRATMKAMDFIVVEYDNPIYRTQRDFKFKETITEEKDTYILEQLEEIRSIQSEQYALLKTINRDTSSNDITFVTNRGIRLSKIASHLNIGISTIVEFLKKENIDIDANPNTKISEDVVLILMSQFGKSEYLDNWIRSKNF